MRRPAWPARALSIGILTGGLGAATGIAAADQRFEADLKREFLACKALEDINEKVACYDKLTSKLTPPTWAGRLTLQTDIFEIDRPTVLRFESDGVIFVMYLKDERGDIVQNLHIGGGGEETYLIEKPGKYSLHINGAEGWRVWLEPQP